MASRHRWQVERGILAKWTGGGRYVRLDFTAEQLQGLGMILREARRARGKTIKAVAEEAGIDAAYLSRIERGKQSPTIEVLRQLTNALDLKELHSVLSLFSSDQRRIDADSLLARYVRERTEDISWRELRRLARDHHIPIPWTDAEAKESPLPRIPPTLAQTLQEAASRSLKARASFAIYLRGLLQYLQDEQAQNLLQSLASALADEKYSEGMKDGVSEALRRLQEAATYALFWALVSFLPPQRALVLHKLHTFLVGLDYMPEVLDGVLEIGRVLAELPPERLEEVMPSLVTAVRNVLPLLAGGQQEGAPREGTSR